MLFEPIARSNFGSLFVFHWLGNDSGTVPDRALSMLAIVEEISSAILRVCIDRPKPSTAALIIDQERVRDSIRSISIGEALVIGRLGIDNGTHVDETEDWPFDQLGDALFCLFVFFFRFWPSPKRLKGPQPETLESPHFPRR